MCISDYKLTTFFYLERFLTKVADDQFSSNYREYLKHNYVPFSREVDWPDIWCFMEVSTKVFTWYGSTKLESIQGICRLSLKMGRGDEQNLWCTVSDGNQYWFQIFRNATSPKQWYLQIDVGRLQIPWIDFSAALKPRSHLHISLNTFHYSRHFLHRRGFLPDKKVVAYHTYNFIYSRGNLLITLSTFFIINLSVIDIASTE